jgi:beta-lactamase regulating signal transducer with metallopeptidase domain
MVAFDTIARIAAERMLNSVVAGLVLTILAWTLLRFLPRTNAGTRVAVWSSVLVAIPALFLAAVFGASGSAASQQHLAPIIVSEGWTFAILAAWGVIAGVALLRVGFGLRRIRRIRRECIPLDIATLDGSVLETLKNFGPKRPVSLLESSRARVPMAVGYFKPAIILPKWTLSELSSAELSSVLLHELAHLRRWDDWTNLFQKVLSALFFFHPALWWLDRQLALDREMACDDMVLAATNNANAYARCLLDVAEKSLFRRSVALAQAAVHHVHDISLRISQIMNSSRPRATRVSKAALAAVSALAGTCLVGVLHSPRLIAFQDSVSYREASRAVPVEVRDLGAYRVVPVTLREEFSGVRHNLRQANSVASLRKPRQPAQVLSASLPLRRDQQPKLLRATLRHARPAMVQAGSLLVVMRDGTVDPTGRVIWTLSVWRLTVFHPAQPSVQEAVVSKSI